MISYKVHHKQNVADLLNSSKPFYPNHTLIGICKLNGVNPFAYLCDILEKLPTRPNRRLQELLRFHWKNPS